jgi:hypothetical protein
MKIQKILYNGAEFKIVFAPIHYHTNNVVSLSEWKNKNVKK